MKVKSKMLGLAIVAMLALGAMASVASAAEFHSEAASTTLSGAQPAAFYDEFITDAGTVECENVSYSGSLSGATTTTASVAPAYIECTTSFGLNAPFDPNGCEYVFHTNPSSFDIACPAGRVMEKTAPGCVITTPAQTGLTGITYTNEGSGSKRIIVVDFAITGIKYEEHNKGFFPDLQSQPSCYKQRHLRRGSHSHWLLRRQTGRHLVGIAP